MDDFIYEYFNNIGTRTVQEDEIVIINNINIKDNYFDMIGVFDGHGGIDSNNYIRENIKRVLEYQKSKSIPSSIASCFKEIDDEICKLKISSGTSLGLILLNKNVGSSYIVILGDVRAILIKDKKIFLTPTHDFNNREELKRFNISEILTINGVRMYRGLSVSRSLGDSDLKYDDDKIISRPDIFKIDNIETLAILSDGVPLNIIKENNFDLNINNLREKLDSAKTLDNNTMIVIKNKSQRIN